VDAGEAGGERDRHGAEEMGGIEAAEGELVAGGGPGGLGGEGDAEADGVEQAELLCDEQRRGVGQRDEAEAQHAQDRATQRRVGRGFGVERHGRSSGLMRPDADRHWAADGSGEWPCQGPVRCTPLRIASLQHCNRNRERRLRELRRVWAKKD
jgi:hypothetical protein